MSVLMCPGCRYPLTGIMGDPTLAYCVLCSESVAIDDAVPGNAANASAVVTRYEPGTTVRAADKLGGYTGVVVLPAGEFEALEGSGWRTATRVRITDPADSEFWRAGNEVDVETGFLAEVKS